MVLQELMLTLCHLFDRRLCRKAEDPSQIEIIRRSPSKVYLQSLPTIAADILQTYNDETLDTYIRYVKTYSEKMNSEECRLPLTQTLVCSKSENSNTILRSKIRSVIKNENEDNTDLDFLPNLPTPKARSVFFALSGLGDDFETINDLCSSCRGDIYLESSVVPHLVIYSHESNITLNSYLLDFYNHGTIEPLVQANGIRRSDVWYLLSEFSRTLATITTSLALHLGLRNYDIGDLISVVGCGELSETEDDIISTASCSSEMSATIPESQLSTRNQPDISKNNEIPENWNSDEDDDFSGNNHDEFVSDGNYTQSTKNDDKNEKSNSRLVNVYLAFWKLQNEFNAKFKEIWS